MAEVVEALAAQPGLPEHPLEAVGHVWGVEGAAELGAEDQPVVLPELGGAEPLLRLAGAVGLEALDDDRREVDRPPAAPGLRLDQAEDAADPLERVPDRQGPAPQVDVLPPQPKRLPLAQADR